MNNTGTVKLQSLLSMVPERFLISVSQFTIPKLFSTAKGSLQQASPSQTSSEQAIEVAIAPTSSAEQPSRSHFTSATDTCNMGGRVGLFADHFVACSLGDLTTPHHTTPHHIHYTILIYTPSRARKGPNPARQLNSLKKWWF